MTDPAAIQGNYADFKLVKTRSVCQLVIEIPIERAEQAIKAFGIPQPASEIPVAVARINPALDTVQDRPEPAEKPHREWREVGIIEQAGILCSKEEFQKWVWEQDGSPSQFPPGPEHAAVFLRAECGVQSRRELKAPPDHPGGTLWPPAGKFYALQERYEQQAGRMAEVHD